MIVILSWAVLYDATQCSLVEVYSQFRGMFFLGLQGQRLSQAGSALPRLLVWLYL
jgi:hypothetical protein